MITVWSMPFGKHKGKPVKDLPNDYLAWLSKQDNITGGLRESIETAIKYKTEYYPNSEGELVEWYNPVIKLRGFIRWDSYLRSKGWYGKLGKYLKERCNVK